MAKPKMDILQWLVIILVSLAGFNWFTVEIFGIDLIVQIFGTIPMIPTFIKSFAGIIGLFTLIWAIRGLYKDHFA